MSPPSYQSDAGNCRLANWNLTTAYATGMCALNDHWPPFQRKRRPQLCAPCLDLPNCAAKTTCQRHIVFSKNRSVVLRCPRSSRPGTQSFLPHSLCVTAGNMHEPVVGHHPLPRHNQLHAESTKFIALGRFRDAFHATWHSFLRKECMQLTKEDTRLASPVIAPPTRLFIQLLGRPPLDYFSEKNSATHAGGQNTTFRGPPPGSTRPHPRGSTHPPTIATLRHRAPSPRRAPPAAAIKPANRFRVFRVR
jgi:hypothetical protein